MTERDARSLTGSRWRISEADETIAHHLHRALGTRPVTARTLVSRGITDEAEARAFLDHDLGGLSDPFEMADMERAVEAVTAALKLGWIVIE